MGNERLRINLLPEERWWGGRVSDGLLMPYGNEGFKADLSMDLDGNQGCPLLVSNKGRFIWSEGAFSFKFENNLMDVSGAKKIEYGAGFRNLRDVYRHVSKNFFPPSGKIPDKLLFTAPQYNLWIELLYEPTQSKVLSYAHSVLENGFPPGVIMIDDNWHEPYGTWKFHPGRFPNPKSMVEELHSLGFKVMLWVCPFVSPDSLTFRQLEKKRYLLNDATGQTVIRRWWNGYSACLDLTNKESKSWIYEQLDTLQKEYGIDGFKFDAGDLPFYENTDESAGPSTRNDHCEAWGRIGLRYPLNEYRACWKLGGQPLAQRLKDKNHSWGGNGLESLIPHALAQSLMGYPFTCPDMIGGGEYENFLANSDKLDPELIVRYAQCSALFPMMQFSAAPWRILDDEHLSYCRQAAKLHAELGGEILELAKESARTGEPIIRHLAYTYPDHGYEDIKDQFLLGKNILVAPVITKGARSRCVHFPTGIWHGDDCSVIQGPCFVDIDVPLSRLPWYRKKNR